MKKYLIFGTLAFLLLLSQTTQAQEWEEATQLEINQSNVMRDLLDVAIGYVTQNGKFQTTKARLPGDFYLTDAQSIKYEFRTTSTLTYYRYNFLMKEDEGPSRVNVTAIVSYNPSNSNFIVTSYSYKIDYKGDGKNDPDVQSNVIDTRTLTGNGDVAKLLKSSFDSVIADNIANGEIPDTKYTISYVYGGYVVQVDREEDAQGAGDDSWPWPSRGWKDFDFWVKFRSSEGKYYLAMINVHYVRGKETGEFGPEIFSLEGSIKLN